jgi:dTDP-4-amino-4,6-dideoxygalactose transaminase
VESLFLSRRPEFLPSTRVALGVGMRAVGVAPGDRVLMPAYHCRALVELAFWCGAEVDYYRVRDDLSADLDDLESRCGPATKCVVIVHYFGFPQPRTRLREFCTSRSIALVEDCATLSTETGRMVLRCRR